MTLLGMCVCVCVTGAVIVVVMDNGTDTAQSGYEHLYTFGDTYS